MIDPDSYTAAALFGPIEQTLYNFPRDKGIAYRDLSGGANN